jgi:S1 RNA binding domain protein
MALSLIKQTLWKPEVGNRITGAITRVEKYGAFVDLGKKKSGLVHVKQMGLGFVDDLTAHVKVGTVIEVEVVEIGADGKVALKKVG